VLTDPARRSAMVARGRVRAAAQTWGGAAGSLWELYRELLAGRPVG
jgi:hypothetical protein